ncbi:MAG: HlyC/CorC family transporter [Rickettsiaceae bacterium]|nr:MAG: HlyC/CorC family transporter [Rickettsiaceae bacterium]
MTILLTIIILVLLTISGLLAATETAITASSPGKLHKLKANGNKKAELVLDILKEKEKVISTMLIGNSLINTVCTTLATVLFIEIFQDQNIGTIVSSIVMAIMIIIFAEVVPKAIAVAKAEDIILSTAPVIEIFLRFLNPVNAMLAHATKIFCQLLNIDLKQEVSGTDEVRGVIEHQHQEGNFYKADRDMLGGILDIRDMTISEIMIHRSNITAIDANAKNEEIVRLALDSPYTRIPLWQDNKENIIGILHIKDLLKALHKCNNDVSKINLQSIITNPWFIPENALAIHQLHAFRERKTHFACVVDEYGDIQGIITLEDILEEIVGQIDDEHDKANQDIITKSPCEFLINGSITIRDLNRELNWNLSDEFANTLAGLIIYEIERIPERGEVIELFNIKFTVVKKTANRIDTIKAKILEQVILSD